MNRYNEIFEMLKGLNAISIAVRILLSVLIGGCIGIDRGRHGRAAGLRTHILVCMGAAMTTMIGLYVSNELGSPGDPLRMGSQVVSGIGFLGAGTIMIRNRSHITGLTTAAGLWATACIGLGIGVGFYEGVLIAFVVAVFTITVLTKLEKSKKYRYRGAYYIELVDITKAKHLYEEIAPLLMEIEIVPARSAIPNHVGLEVVAMNSQNNYRLQSKLKTCNDIVIAVPLH